MERLLLSATAQNLTGRKPPATDPYLAVLPPAVGTTARWYYLPTQRRVSPRHCVSVFVVYV